MSSWFWLYCAITGGLTTLFIGGWYSIHRSMNRRIPITQGVVGPAVSDNDIRDTGQSVELRALQRSTIPESAFHRFRLSPSTSALAGSTPPVGSGDGKAHWDASGLAASMGETEKVPFHVAGGLGVQGARMFDKTCSRCAAPIR